MMTSIQEAVTTDEERELCRKYESRIRGYGLRHLRDSAAAADLVQHVLVAVLQAVRAGKVENLDAYVLGTCRFAVLDMKRGEARQRRVAEQAAAGLPEGYMPSLVGADLVRLEMCLQTLEPRDLAVVVGTFLHDQDAEELARVLALSAGNVRVIRHRALAKLQLCVGGAA
jgi:RNA polymerase sigma-70 factor, ECF subfamily